MDRPDVVSTVIVREPRPLANPHNGTTAFRCRCHVNGNALGSEPELGGVYDRGNARACCRSSTHERVCRCIRQIIDASEVKVDRAYDAGKRRSTVIGLTRVGRVLVGFGLMG